MILDKTSLQARNLVGWWPFGDRDYVTGTPVQWQTSAGRAGNVTPPRPLMKKGGYCGATRYAICPNTARFLRSSSQFTIMGWWYQSSTTAGAIFGTDNGFPDRLELEYSSGQATAVAGGQVASFAASPVAWNHAALTMSGAVLTLYLNGKSVASNSSASTTAATIGNLLIGRVNGGAQVLQVAGADWRVYGVPLSAAQVLDCYQRPMRLRKEQSFHFLGRSGRILFRRTGMVRAGSRGVTV